MSSPKFSIVIPAAGHTGPLKGTLLATLAQSYRDFEILVLDNSAGSDVATLCAATGSDKVRHLPVDPGLSLADIWEYGIPHTSGDFVTVLDNGSALTLDACKAAAQIASLNSAEVIAWTPHRYWGPDALPDQHRNHLTLRCAASAELTPAFAGINALAAFYKFKLSLDNLPKLSNAFVARTALEKIKAATSRYFGGTAPDIYAGIANCCVSAKFTYVERPLSVRATTAYSVDAAFAHADSCGANLRASFGKSTPPDPRRGPHPVIGTLFGSIPIVQQIMAMAFARDDLFPQESRIPLNSMKLVDTILAHADHSLALYDDHIAAAKTVAACTGLSLDRFPVPERPKGPIISPDLPQGPVFNENGGLERVEINTKTAGIDDIFGVVQFVHASLGPLC